ncbi:MAG: PhaM family polyhydroxyalkanoate granule multifunctional regulatory protein [Rhodoferax sp.]|uniref:PhaM family polyhydroxyalkanoate granule multifunctional regulatory protein n=1 Tax=Rhodoferax sp. TaxID=50421 RepID=UPI002ACDA821|nr:PhaM family polyhydroxyalkanoate granule multifunctional regulatory protein [Rhodoferax sp.]MDZ7890282.1 PhaM family polyhydroxyalkanoate granule multifunctional regulatory protein [Rhodoferax sp.]
MSDSDTTGFGKFVPGFDFLQNLAKGAGSNIPQMPNLGNWVAPTLNVEELDKRIDELKNVHFWLEQNSRALAATIQALEVQKMTLATLKGMNFNIGDMANALKLKAADSVYSGVQKATEKATETAKSIAEAATGKLDRKFESKSADTPAANPLGDPLQLWGALTQQFQQIAANALKEATSKTAVDITKNMAAGLAKDALKTAKAATKKAVAKKAAPRKAPARKASGR